MAALAWLALLLNAVQLSPMTVHHGMSGHGAMAMHGGDCADAGSAMMAMPAAASHAMAAGRAGHDCCGGSHSLHCGCPAVAATALLPPVGVLSLLAQARDGHLAALHPEPPLRPVSPPLV